MSNRFRVLLSPINLSAEKTKKVVLAVCVLHNYLMTTNKQKYAPPNSFDRYDENGELILGDWRQDHTSDTTMFGLEGENAASGTTTAAEATAKVIQEEFMNYFIEEGELEWQYGMLS